VTDGAPDAVVTELQAAAQEADVVVELVAPEVGGVTPQEGGELVAEHQLSGAPSVLFDAVVLCVSRQGAESLAEMPAARDFLSDAYVHCKFVGYTRDASELLTAVGLGDKLDDGFVDIEDTGAVAFLERCGALRYWERQPASRLASAPHR
jgi:catalase